jgi:hypothetical protein
MNKIGYQLLLRSILAASVVTPRCAVLCCVVCVVSLVLCAVCVLCPVVV